MSMSTDMRRKLPIGIQNFEFLRSEGYLYIDKTALIYRLVTKGKPYFLSRPRRFGKSLLLSTLEAYFKGKKELFKGLAIEQLEQNWYEYPVLHLSLNAEKYDSRERLEKMLELQLEKWEEMYGVDKGTMTYSGRFSTVIRRACEQTGRRVVVLVDEYDKPMLQTFDNPDLQEDFRKTLTAFYTVLKDADPYLQFVFITGVTKFAQMGIFRLRTTGAGGAGGNHLRTSRGAADPQVRRLPFYSGKRIHPHVQSFQRTERPCQVPFR